jgi:hypothetical protein
MGFMGVAGLLMVWYFQRKGWIGPEDLPGGRSRARLRKANAPTKKNGPTRK